VMPEQVQEPLEHKQAKHMHNYKHRQEEEEEQELVHTDQHHDRTQ
jgi:hypothetical protein